jgi:O-glycosyl hydrolase
MTARTTAFLMLGMAAAGCSAETVVTDGRGRVTAMVVRGESVDVQTDLRIPRPAWTRLPGLEDAREVKTSVRDGKKVWAGKINVDQGKTCNFEEAIEQAEGVARIELSVRSETDIETEGVYFWLDVPIPVFAGGQADIRSGNAPVAQAEMPREKPERRHFVGGIGDHLTLSDARAQTRVEVTLDRTLPITVQDTREWQGTTYSAFIRLAGGPLRAGQEVAAKMELRAAVQPDTTPAQLAVDASKVRYRLDGFGGNYCFGIESPVTQYTLANLNIAWARTEMTPYEWEPQNDNDDPSNTNWDYLKSQDKPDSNLRREFELAKQIQSKGIPYVISIWGMPMWIYDPPATTVRGGPRKIAADKWDEALECIGSYLVYARDQYGVEPNLFCFNEPNYGVDVHLTPEEHRDAIKRLGAYFQRLGLKTKMLLGDATGPRGTQTYVEPAAADPDAMKYVEAVAFHSWGGASAAEYSAWGDVAERLKLPLLVTELGVDAGAWRTQSYDSFRYALQEVEMYQQLLLYARPQGTMQWEFTSDYSIVREQRDAAGQVTLTPTVRFWFVKHFCNLTPHGADALTTTSDHPKVLVTAFRGEAEGQAVTTIHIANLGAEREATITGLPADARQLRVVRTSETQSFAEGEPVAPKERSLKLTLPALSLTTLTTMAEG